MHWLQLRFDFSTAVRQQ